MDDRTHRLGTSVAIEFIEQSKRLRATHYRKEAERFKEMADKEPLRSLRRHLHALASEYEHMAASVVVPSKR